MKRLRRADFTRLLELRPKLRGLPYWVAAAVVGVIAVVYSLLFTRAIDFAHQLLNYQKYSLFIWSPVCLFLSAWVVDRFARPAGGTGVPQVIFALSLDSETQAQQIDQYLNLRVAAVVMLSSLLCVLGGGGLGREGPMVHMAACIFYFVGKQFNKVWPYAEHRSWIAAGGAAGISAAFNAPLAGVVFVLEELAQDHFHRFKNFVISGAIIGGLVSQFLSGRYLYFGFVKIQHVPTSSVFWALLVGLICGLLALPFHRLIQVNWREKVGVFGLGYRFAAVLGLAVAALAIYTDSGTIGGGVNVIERLLTPQGEHATWALIVGRFLITIVTHLSGCAGGFLAPSLTLGAAIGSKLSDLLEFADHNLLVLVGMSAFLSAIVRAPFTAWVIVMEMTDQHYAIFPLMVASLVSSATVQRLVDKKTES